MQNHFLFIFLVFNIFACQESPKKMVFAEDKDHLPTLIKPSIEEELTPTAIIFLDTIPTPKGYTKIDEISGDLDKDDQAERVFVFETPRPTEFGNEREIHIYRLEDASWQLWHTSSGAILLSEDGGAFGDPFSGVDIENGCLVISHFGGSRQRWGYTHRFRFQNNDWQLIGATVIFGAPCDYWEQFDYNLSTGNIHYKKETEKCDENDEELSTTIVERKFKNTFDYLPGIDNFYPGSNEIEIKDTDTKFYF